MGYGQTHEIIWGVTMTFAALIMSILATVTGSLNAQVFIEGKKDEISENNAKIAGIVDLALGPIGIGLCIQAFISIYKLNQLYEKARLNDDCKACARRCHLMGEVKNEPAIELTTLRTQPQPFSVAPVATVAAPVDTNPSNGDYSDFF